MPSFDVPLHAPRLLLFLEGLLLVALFGASLLLAASLRSRGLDIAATAVPACAALLVLARGTCSVHAARGRATGLLHVDTQGRASWRSGGHVFRCRVERWRAGTHVVALSLRVTDAVDGPSERGRAARRIDLVSGPGRGDDEAFRRLRAWLTWMSRETGGPRGPA